MIEVMKSYTDLEQSERLSKILPFESADMYYEWPNKKVHFKDDKYSGMGSSCWSLSALLTILNKDFYPNIFHDGETWNLEVTHHDDNTIKYDTCGDDLLDICFRVIVFLHEQNLL